MSLNNVFIRLNVIGSIQAKIDQRINQYINDLSDTAVVNTRTTVIYAFPLSVELNEKEKKTIIGIYATRKSYTCKIVKLPELLKLGTKNHEVNSSLHRQIIDAEEVTDETDVIIVTKQRF